MNQLCENGAMLIQDKYYLFNNLWGADTGSGSQCTWTAASKESPMAWRTSWHWSGPAWTARSHPVGRGYDQILCGHGVGLALGLEDRRLRIAGAIGIPAKPAQYLGV